MRRFLLLSFLLVPTALLAERDVNGDGTVDLADVRALGRMAVGLAPANLRFDQDGDGAVTLRDAEVLYDGLAAAAAPALAPPSPPPASLAPPPAAPSPTAPAAPPQPTRPQPPPPRPELAAAPVPVQLPAVAFYAVQRGDGACVVAVGDQALQPGDIVFGRAAAYEEAQRTLTERCPSGARPPAPPPAVPPPTAPAPLRPDQPAAPPPPAAAPSNPALAAPILALPKYDDDDSVKGIFFINLDSGNAFFIDRVKHSPLDVRTRPSKHNIFTALGRTAGRPARAGEVLVGEVRNDAGDVRALLLADTAVGRVAFIAGLEDRSAEGTLRVMEGRPLGALASSDGNFALLMVRDSSGETRGAYLFHATTGRCLYLANLQGLGDQLAAMQTTPLPAFEGRASAIDLQSGSEETGQFLLADNANGGLFRVRGVQKGAKKLTAAPERTNLLQGFPAEPEAETLVRFLFLPVFSGSGATRDVLVVDGGSGMIGLLEEARDPSTMRLKVLKPNLYSHWPMEVGRPRSLAGVPKVDDSGATEGAWIFDSATGQILYLDGLDAPEGALFHPVEQKTR